MVKIAKTLREHDDDTRPLREPPDATDLLRALISLSDHAPAEPRSEILDRSGVMRSSRLADEFDPHSPTARASLERILQAPPSPTSKARRSQARKLAIAAAPIALATAGGLSAALSLSGSRGGIAKASVLAHAATALQQPGTIAHLKVTYYSAHSLGPCLPAGRPLQEGMPALSECLGGQSPVGEGEAQGTSVSANPEEDAITYTSEAWSSPNGSEERVLFGDGDEAMRNTNTGEYETFAAADNEVTTLTEAKRSDPGSQCSPPFGPALSASALVSPSCYEALFKQAKTGRQHVQLIGQTRIEGASVYELEFDFDPQPPKSPPAGDMCGKAVCTPPGMEMLLYLDSDSFAPVRLTHETVNPDDRPGIPPGTSISSVTDFAVESLPDTPENEYLLQMPSHPGATRIEQTEAHYRQELGAVLKSLAAKHAH